MSNRLPHAKPGADGVTDRLGDLIAMWKRFWASAKEYEVNAAFVLGDLFDKSNVDPVTLAASIEVFHDATCPVYILPGNHDGNDPVRGGRYVPEAFGKMGLENVHYISAESGPYNIGSWLRFWPIEYTDLDRTRRLLAEANGGVMAAPPKRREILLMHQSIIGCTHFGWNCDAGIDPEELAGWDEVYAGHFHTFQTFGRNGMYLGAPIHHRFDDEGRKAGWWLVEWEKGKKTKRKFIDGGAPKFHTLEWPERRTDATRGDYLRLHVTATMAEYITAKPAIKEFLAEMAAAGIIATHKHRPVYHHEARMVEHAEMATMSLENAVESYVDAADVSIEGLDRGELKRLGASALEFARRSDARASTAGS